MNPVYNSPIVVGVLLVLSGIGPGSHFVTSQAPSTVAVLAGTSTTLRCTTGSTLNFATWGFAASGTSSLVTISSWDGTKCIQSASFPQYQFNTTYASQGQCDLVIPNVALGQAGWYQCAGSQQVGGNYAFNAQVTVLASAPQCSQNVTANVAEYDVVSMECNVTYSSNGLDAIVLWSGCSYETLSDNTTSNGDLTTSTVHTISTVATRQQYLQTCTGNSMTLGFPPDPPFAGGITSSSTFHYSSIWTSQYGIPVQYCPRSVEMYPSSQNLSIHSEVNCSADSYPTPVYTLRVQPPGSSVVTEIPGSSLTLTTPGIYYITCRAAVNISSEQNGEYACESASNQYMYEVTAELTTEYETTAIQTTATTPIATTTLPSSAPRLHPAPYVLATVGGAMNASEIISSSCANFIASDFRSSFQEIVSRINTAISGRLLCIDGFGAMTVMPGQVQTFFFANQVQLEFSLLVGTNPGDIVTIGLDESCSWDASQFVQVLDNWRQPIVSNIFGCPVVDITPPGFAWQSSQWGCF